MERIIGGLEKEKEEMLNVLQELKDILVERDSKENSIEEIERQMENEAGKQNLFGSKNYEETQRDDKKSRRRFSGQIPQLLKKVMDFPTYVLI